MVNTIPELKEVLVNKDYLSENKLIIGGGSNILFTQDYSGLVIKLNNSNIEILSETKDNVFTRTFFPRAGDTRKSLIAGNIAGEKSRTKMKWIGPLHFSTSDSVKM